jgi:hypothetical protein
MDAIDRLKFSCANDTLTALIERLMVEDSEIRGAACNFIAAEDAYQAESDSSRRLHAEVIGSERKLRRLIAKRLPADIDPYGEWTPEQLAECDLSQPAGVEFSVSPAAATNEYADADADKIDQAIRARLRGDAFHYWNQQPRDLLYELCGDVQSGRLTIDQATAMVEEWSAMPAEGAE